MKYEIIENKDGRCYLRKKVLFWWVEWPATEKLICHLIVTGMFFSLCAFGVALKLAPLAAVSFILAFTYGFWTWIEPGANFEIDTGKRHLRFDKSKTTYDEVEYQLNLIHEDHSFAPVDRKARLLAELEELKRIEDERAIQELLDGPDV